MKKLLAKHKWLVDCIINEMIDTDTEKRYFVATIYGWQHFYIPYTLSTDKIIAEVKSIRERMDAGDDSVFTDPKYFRKSVLKNL